MDPIGSTGQVVAGKYRLAEPIGAGGSVWMAVDETLQRPVALKFPRGVVDGQRAATVRHPFVVAVLDHGQAEDGTAFVVTEYLDGMSLGARLRHGSAPPLPVVELIRIIHQALAGLAAIHRAGLAHGDLKPDNILLCRGWPTSGPLVAQLVDFGMSDDRAWVEPDGDLRSVGFILSQALTAKLLRRDQAPLPASALLALRPDLPSELMELVARATGADPGAGFTSADQLAVELREAARRIPAHSTCATGHEIAGAAVTPLPLIRRKLAAASTKGGRRWSLPRFQSRFALGILIAVGTLATAGWARLARAPGRGPAAERVIATPSAKAARQKTAGIVITPIGPRHDRQP
jgi:serine/threonine protein kinase